MKKLLSVAVLVAAAFAVAASAQQKPNFSGTWVLVGATGGATQEETIEHTATTLTLSHAASHDSHHGIVFKLDGTESRNVLASHGEQIVSLSTASWNGDQLVILRKTTYPDGRKIDSRITFALNSDGQLVQELVDTSDGKVGPKITTVKRRK